MTTAIDTNILLDILLPDPTHGESSLKSLEKAFEQGALVICEIVYAELSSFFESREQLDRTLKRMGIAVVPLTLESAFLAGRMWRNYRSRNQPRDRMITDFLIGAFAKAQADQFLSRDRGFYRDYFDGLRQMES